MPGTARQRRGRRALHGVAAFEAFKGVTVLLAATGLLALMHQDLHDSAAKFIEHLHLNPASHYPSIFIDAAGSLAGPRLLLLALGAAVYSAVRLIEAYGLFRGRAWAEWLAALSGAIYIPPEIYGLLRTRSALGMALLVLNVSVVAIVARSLARRRGHRGPEGLI